MLNTLNSFINLLASIIHKGNTSVRISIMRYELLFMSRGALALICICPTLLWVINPAGVIYDLRLARDLGQGNHQNKINKTSRRWSQQD